MKNACRSLLRNTGAWMALLLGVLTWPMSTFAVAGPVPDTLIRRTETPCDTSLLISSTALLQQVKRKENVLIIDVRPEAAFNALHITGAIHVSLHFVKTKPYLKSAPVILVEQGLAYHRLAPVCRELRKIGASVRLLDGGMHAWCCANGPTVGDAVRQMAYDKLSPADFFQEKNYAHRIVCDISVARSAASQTLMPYAVHLPVTDGPAGLDRIGKTRDDVLIVVSQNGSDYADAAHRFSQAGHRRIYYLEGGINAYQVYLEGLTRSWQPREIRTRGDGSCKPCREANRGQRNKP